MSDLVRYEQPSRLSNSARACIIGAAWLTILSLPLGTLVAYGLRKLPDSNYAQAFFEENFGIPSSKVSNLHLDFAKDGYSWLLRFTYRDDVVPDLILTRLVLRKGGRKKLDFKGMERWQADLAKFECYENDRSTNVWIERSTKRCFILRCEDY